MHGTLAPRRLCPQQMVARAQGGEQGQPWGVLGHERSLLASKGALMGMRTELQFPAAMPCEAVLQGAGPSTPSQGP